MSSEQQDQEIIDSKKREVQRLKDENKSIREQVIRTYSDDRKIDENLTKIDKLESDITRLENQKKKD